MQKPSLGRIVHYRVQDGDKRLLDGFDPENGETASVVLPAIITRVWNNKGLLNIQVISNSNGMVLKTSVSQGNEKGTWNWPEIVAPVDETIGATTQGGENPGGPTPPIPPKGQ